MRGTIQQGLGSSIWSLSYVYASESIHASIERTLTLHPSLPHCTATKCKSNNDCTEADSFCDTPKCVAPGTCVVAPQFCPLIYSPVCGCDNRTYSNSCYAQAAYMYVLSLSLSRQLSSTHLQRNVTDRIVSVNRSVMYRGACE